MSDMYEPYMEFLRNEGFVPNREDDGPIVFRFEGSTFLVLLDEKDPEFFRLVFPSIWRISDELERRQAVDAANAATAKIKVAKVFVGEDGVVHAAIELFSDSPQDVTKVITRSLRALRSAAQSFAQSIQA